MALENKCLFYSTKEAFQFQILDKVANTCCFFNTMKSSWNLSSAFSVQLQYPILLFEQNFLKGNL